jgi:hypothetical protein
VQKSAAGGPGGKACSNDRRADTQRSGPTACPATFHYITDEQLRSTMWRLAYHSRELRVLMASPEEIAVNRAEVLQHLRGMEQLTIDLKSTRMTDQSPMVDANRSSLLWQIRTAQDGISRIPRIFSGRGGFGSLCLLSRKPVSNAAIMGVHSGPNRYSCGISKYAA